MIQIVRFTRLSQVRAEIQRDARTIFDVIGRDVRQAMASTITVDAASNQPPYSRIQFTRIDGDTVSYYQEGGKLMHTRNIMVKELTDDVRYIAFTYPRTDDDQIVSVSLTLEQLTYEGGTKAIQLSVEKVRVMNE